MKTLIIILSILLFSSFSFAEEPCDEKAFKIKYNQERITQIENEVQRHVGVIMYLNNEKESIFQQNQQLRQPEPEKKINESP